MIRRQEMPGLLHFLKENSDDPVNHLKTLGFFIGNFRFTKKKSPVFAGDDWPLEGSRCDLSLLDRSNGFAQRALSAEQICVRTYAFCGSS